jgi:hypothetical protein
VGFTGRLHIAGSVGDRQVQSRMWVATMLSAATRLESIESSGHRPFILSAVGEEATLLLPQDGRVVAHEPAAAILGAALGLPLRAADLQRVIACPRAGGSMVGWRLSDNWLRVTMSDGDEVFDAYLRRDRSNRPLTLVAMLGLSAAPDGARWRAEFHHKEKDTWRKIRLTSVDLHGQLGRDYDLTLSLDRIQINPPWMGPSALARTVPLSARPMTLDELRPLGPLVGIGGPGQISPRQ